MPLHLNSSTKLVIIYPFAANIGKGWGINFVLLADELSIPFLL
jgi:hypothetical protein